MTKKLKKVTRTCQVCGLEKDRRGGYYKDNKEVCRKCVNAGKNANPFNLTEADIKYYKKNDPAALEQLLKISSTGAFLFQPQDYQRQFFADIEAHTYRQYLVTAGNRLGKSQSVMCALARIALTTKNLKIVVVTNTYATISQVIVPKLFKDFQFKIPKKGLTGYQAYQDGAWGPPLIPQEFIREFHKGRSGMDLVVLTNGTEIRAIPASAETADRFQGWVADYVFLDEALPPGTNGMLAEIQTRLLDRDGSLVCSATFLDASQEIIDWFVDIEDGVIPNSHKYKWGLSDANHISEEMKQRFRATIPKHLLGVKTEGELSARAGLVIPKYRDAVITAQECPILYRQSGHWIIDRRCEIIVGIDPGGGKARFGIVMCAINAENRNAYFIDSDYTEANQTVEKAAKNIARLCQRWHIPKKNGITRIVMDCATDRGPLGSLKVEMSKWLKHYGIRASNTGTGVISAEKMGKNGALDKMRQTFESGRAFLVKNRCTKLIKELSYYSWDARTGKPKKRGYIDCCDATLYICNLIPKSKKAKHWTRTDYVEEFFQEAKKRRLREKRRELGQTEF